MSSRKRSSQYSAASGFTIIELLVATVVFSVVLLVVTAGILQISRVYYKGVTEANTQNVARSIIDTISQAIQFNGGNVTTTPGSPTPGSPYAFCIGNQQFSYTLGYQMVDNPDSAKFQTYHALVANTVAGCTSSTPAQNVRQQAVIGRELLSPNMRLSKLSITSAGANLYRIEVRVAYGDDDLLKTPTGATTPCIDANAGTQFCAISELSTVVTKRVQ